MAERYMLGKPYIGKNFVQYPACKDVNVLAQFGLVEVIFPELVTTSKLQVSLVDCNTNTLLYLTDGTPVLPNQLTANIPYRIKFSPCIGGYVIISDNVCTTPSVPAKVSDENKKEVVV